MAEHEPPAEVRPGGAGGAERRAGVEKKAVLVGALVALVLLGVMAAVMVALLGPLAPVLSDDVEQAAYRVELRGWIGSVIALVVSFIAGGAVAARTAHHNEPVNGIAAAAVAAVVVFAFAIVGILIGSDYDLPARIGLPSWSEQYAARVFETLLGASIWLAVMLGSGWVGGALGSKTAGRRPDIA